MIQFSNYTLSFAKPLQNKNAFRQGALLKVTFEDGATGYADCHPWEELGDLSLKEQLETLRNNKTTPLLERSLHFARLDASARKLNQSLFENVQIPQSHLLFFDNSLNAKDFSEAFQKGFVLFKIKLGKQWKTTVKQLTEILKELSSLDFRLRLDFNNQLTQPEFTQFLSAANSLLPKIDYIEDPFPFDVEAWTEIQIDFPVRLACDHLSFKALDFPHAAPVLIVKPAIQDEAIFLRSVKNDQELVFSSYLDHPVGQMYAAYVAALCQMKSPSRISTCGLFSHSVYLPDPFINAIRNKGNRLLAPQGTGIGFDNLLKNLPWTNV